MLAGERRWQRTVRGLFWTIVATGPATPLLTAVAATFNRMPVLYNELGARAPIAVLLSFTGDIGGGLLLLLYFSLPSIGFAFVAEAILSRAHVRARAQATMTVAGGVLGLLGTSVWHCYDFWSNYPNFASNSVYLALAFRHVNLTPFFMLFGILPGVIGALCGLGLGLLIGTVCLPDTVDPPGPKGK